LRRRSRGRLRLWALD
jgi:hypothetical protein